MTKELKSRRDASCGGRSVSTLLFGETDGERGLAAEIELDSGLIIERRVIDEAARPPISGVSKKCGSVVVTHYCDPADGKLHIQAGSKRVLVDEETTATHTWARCALVSQLDVTRVDGDGLRVRYVSGLRGLIFGRDADALPYPDETEFLFAMAAAINTPERRARVLERWYHPPS